LARLGKEGWHTRTRSRITVREVAYDTGLGDDLFGVAHLSAGP
jgi:hypothetical protein